MTPPTTTEAAADTVLPDDAEAIMQRALAEEAPTAAPGTRRLSAAELAFQRRAAVVLTVLPLVGLAVAVPLLWGTGISALDAALLGGFYCLTALGITVGYHRLFTHRSFRAPAPVRAAFAVAGSLAIEGPLTKWVADHRRHHAYADEFGDPHSPHLVQDTGWRGVLKGLWHAHAGWFFADQDETLPERWTPDLLEDPVLAWVSRRFGWFVALSLALPPLIAFTLTGSLAATATAFLWGSLVRVFFVHHVTWSINSICHFFGERPFASRDEATNNWPLSVVSFGESWHNNHHAFPTSARHGLLRGQIDPSWRLIRTLQWLRLADQVRVPSERAIAKKWVVAPRRLARF